MDKPEWYDTNKAADRNGRELEWEELEPELQYRLWSFHNRGLALDDAELLAALRRLQSMRESGEFCCITLDSDYDYVWDIAYVHENLHHERRHQWRKLEGSFDRLSEAIDAFHDLWKEGKLEDDEHTYLYDRSLNRPQA